MNTCLDFKILLDFLVRYASNFQTDKQKYANIETCNDFHTHTHTHTPPSPTREFVKKVGHSLNNVKLIRLTNSAFRNCRG